MPARDILMSSSGSAGDATTYVDDVFSAYTYTGNGSTQTITNGIDLAGEGGMVWIKSRSAATDHQLFDTARTATHELISNSPAAQVADTDTLTAFNSAGFALGADATTNTNAATYVSWTFRKAPKFFDVVTYTGTGPGVAQTINHSLGITPGMIIVKRTSAVFSWRVYHRRANDGVNPQNYYLTLDTTDVNMLEGTWGFTSPTSADFTVAYDGGVNQLGQTYVAYLFAHDTGTDGMIQCGSLSGNTAISLGWEPQYIMYKRTDSTGNWIIVDSMRGIPTGSVDPELYPNLTNAETASASDYITLNATGFTTTNLTGTFIYLAIRRPNKPPTSGTQVFVPTLGANVTTALQDAYTTGFPVDMFMEGRDFNGYISSRLVGGRCMSTPSTGVEVADGGYRKYDSSTGLRAGYVYNFSSLIGWCFRRAPGFFAVVCYTGSDSVTTVNHNLGVAPELILVKRRNATWGWAVYHKDTGNNYYMLLNANDAKAGPSNYWNATTPTSTVFSVQAGNNVVNISSGTYVAYLFATLAGISKVGSYTGNGSNQTINCGFAAGARFILIKRTDSTGDWFVWDSVRGIVAANDPHLSLNTTTAEVTTDDSIDPDNSGFIVNQVAATNINVTSATYIYLAIA